MDVNATWLHTNLFTAMSPEGQKAFITNLKTLDFSYQNSITMNMPQANKHVIWDVTYKIEENINLAINQVLIRIEQ